MGRVAGYVGLLVGICGICEVFGLAPSAISAQAPAAEAPTPEDSEAANVARARFREGMEHFQARRFREAIQSFRLAAQAVPSADLWFNIARAYEELSDPTALPLAVEHYRRYLRDRVDPPDRDAVERRIASLEERIEGHRRAMLERPTTGTLRIGASHDGAEVRVGDQPVGETPVAAPLTLAPGQHPVALEREGYVPFRAEVRVDAGATTTSYARLTPQTRYRAVRGRRIWTWVLTGLAAAALAATVGLGVHARSLARDDLEQGRRWAAFSDYALGGTMALGVTALVVGFFEGRAIGTEEVTTPP
ncbi:MAG: PEGA domain-containing protein [Myxococcales bacterium]|nr:PEGA domain-containing protein [Myxococcales bacterium]